MRTSLRSNSLRRIVGATAISSVAAFGLLASSAGAQDAATDPAATDDTAAADAMAADTSAGEVIVEDDVTISVTPDEDGGFTVEVTANDGDDGDEYWDNDNQALLDDGGDGVLDPEDYWDMDDDDDHHHHHDEDGDVVHDTSNETLPPAYGGNTPVTPDNSMGGGLEGGHKGGGLAATGSEAETLALVGLVALAGGAGVVVRTRQRFAPID